MANVTDTLLFYLNMQNQYIIVNETELVLLEAIRYHQVFLRWDVSDVYIIVDF